MFDCNNYSNLTAAFHTCSLANIASSTITTAAGALGSHMVSQYGKFQDFVASDAPPIEKAAGYALRLFTGTIGATCLGATLLFAPVSAALLLKGRISDSLKCGLLTASFAAMTCFYASMTLDHVGTKQAVDSALDSMFFSKK